MTHPSTPAPPSTRVSPPVVGTVVEIFFRYLKAEGVRVVFGIPGGLLHPFFEVLEGDPDIDLVVAKHEEGAAFMADGYARVSRTLAVCAGTSGPGATNMITGVACAFADGVPMLVVTGQAASSALGKGAAQETSREDMDIVAMFRPVTKYSAMVTSAESLPMHLRRALRYAMTGRPGPVHLNIPVDLWLRPLTEDWFDPKTYRPTTHTFDRVELARAARLLSEARRPLLFAGSGVVIGKAEDHLKALAELLPARVATTPRAKGAFPEDHPLSLGVMGFAGHAAAREGVLDPSVDLLFAIGTSLSETSTLNWHPGLGDGRSFIQLDIDADRVGRNYPVDVGLVGDAQTILIELVYHLHRSIRDGGTPAASWSNLPPKSEGRYLAQDRRVSTAVPLTPERWRKDLQEVLPDDVVIFSDIGGHMLNNIHHLEIRKNQRFVLNLGFGSMGHGTVAPIGAALAEPGRPVVAIIGDACFAMNGMELLVAVERDIPVVWIVENNNMHGITWHGSKLVGSKVPLRSIENRRPMEVAAIARAMGMSASVVDRPDGIKAAFVDALRAGGPCLIEVRVDPSIAPPLGDRAKSVAGFVRQ